MEKRVPHYLLAEVRDAVRRRGATAFTRSALRNGYAMGLTTQDMIDVVCSLTSADFFKSMTSYHDHTLWQDVYHACTPVGVIAYIKLSDPHGTGPVIQFKEK